MKRGSLGQDSQETLLICCCYCNYCSCCCFFYRCCCHNCHPFLSNLPCITPFTLTGDGALTVGELQAHNLTPPHPTTRLAPTPSKHRNLSVDFKGQLAREHDHVTRKKEQMNRQRDQLFVRDRNTPRNQHRQEQRMQGRPWIENPLFCDRFELICTALKLL